jgi:fucose permease
VRFFLGPFLAKKTILRKVQKPASAFFVVVQFGAAVYPAVAGVIAVQKGAEVLQLL